MASRDNDTVSNTAEATPLLKANQPVGGKPVDHYRRRVVFLCFAILIFLGLGAGLFVPGSTAAFEQKICHDVYANSGEADWDCKAPVVQGKIASIRGWQTTLECIPGLVATVPFGMLSDKWGRHRVMTLALIGTTLSIAHQLVVHIPVEFIFLSFVFMFVGGGPAVIAAMVYTSVADIVPVSSRAPTFLQFSACSIIADIASGPFAGLVLMKSVRGLNLLAFGFIVLASLISFFLPDTLRLVEPELFITRGGDAPDASETPADHEWSPIDKSLRKARNVIQEVRAFLRGHWHVIALTLCFVFVALSRVVQEMLLQYTTKRYHLTWSKASFLLTIRGLVSLVTLMVVLPAASQFLTTKLKMSATRKDVWIARVTGLAGVIGALLIAFASNLAVLILGLVILAFNGGMPGVIRSLLSGMVEPHHMGTLNSLIGVLEMIGIMVAAPALFGSLRIGFELGAGWIGLPFICAAAIIFVSTVIVWVTPPRESQQSANTSLGDDTC